MNRFLRKFLPFVQPPPLIALLTDFGLSDHYVGTMKGVISSVYPFARIIDISHSVGPQNVRQAAYLLWSCYRYFPTGTIFVAVVDPGVGTARNIYLMEINARWFLVPDNGIVDFMLQEQRAGRSYIVNTSDSPYLLRTISKTFHGRDIFAPIAAHISKGVEPNEIGVPSPSPRPVLSFRRSPDRSGSILHVDHFGNIVTDILVGEEEKPRAIRLKNHVVRQWISHYAEGPATIPCLIRGSSGLLEIVVKNGNAAELLKAGTDTALKVTWV